MPDSKMQRVLGTATYSAIRSATDGLVTLRAVGLLNCANYKAQLEQRPERILPPFYDMAFYVSDFCLPAMQPFDISVTVFGAHAAETITVFDATGTVEVPIADPREQDTSTEAMEPAADRDEYVVYARLTGVPGQHHGCIVVPADTIVPAIYYLAFGPASKEECDAFASENCKPSIGLPKIPWPSGEE